MSILTNEEFTQGLLKRRTLYLGNHFDRDDAREIGRLVLWLNAQDETAEITLYLDSSGGGVTTGLDIHDIIRQSKAPVSGIVYRQAYSMACVILQACTTRKAMRQSILGIHNCNIRDTEWHLFEEDLEKALRSVKGSQREINMILSARTGRPIEEIDTACREAKSMSAAEAKEFGLIDEIL